MEITLYGVFQTQEMKLIILSHTQNSYKYRQHK